MTRSRFLLAAFCFALTFPVFQSGEGVEASSHKAAILRALYAKPYDGCFFCDLASDGCFQCMQEAHNPDKEQFDHCEVLDCENCEEGLECSDPDGILQFSARQSEEIIPNLSDETILQVAEKSPRLAATLALLNKKVLPTNKMRIVKWTPIEISASEIRFWLDRSSQESVQFRKDFTRRAKEISIRREKIVVIKVYPTKNEILLAVVDGGQNNEELINVTVPLRP